jgi:hypothetical protein
MPLNDKQKTYLRIGIAALVFFYIAPRIIGLYLQHQAIQRAAFAAAHAKPSPMIPKAPQPLIAPPPVQIAMGRYEGAGVELTRQCKINLELRAGENGTYLGYVTMMCFEPPHIIPGKPVSRQNPIMEAARQMTPASAIMTGNVKNGDLVFTVDKSIGTLGDGCPITGTFTVTTFGLGKVMAQWQEGTCQGGQLILAHI